MHTDYQKVNHFDVAVVTMILVGFVLIGGIIFSSLTPRGQTDVTEALSMFDIHEQAAMQTNQTLDTVNFVLDVQSEFYNQFYKAFSELAVMPEDTFEVPIKIAHNLAGFFNDLSVQVAEGYEKQNQMTKQIAYSQGQVLGAVMDLSGQFAAEPQANVLSGDCAEAEPTQVSLKIPYQFVAPDFNQIKSQLINYINP